MSKFEVDLEVINAEVGRLENLMNDYEECVELIGHLTRVFNREGYWDFRENLGGIYKRACKHENDLNNFIEGMQSINDIYTKSETKLVNNGMCKKQELYTATNALNVEFILGGMRAITKDESYKIIKSFSGRGDISIGIDTKLLLTTTTLHSYVDKFNQLRFKLVESTNSTYADRSKLFESQTEDKWNLYGDNLQKAKGTSVYNTQNNTGPLVLKRFNNYQNEEVRIEDGSEVIIDAINLCKDMNTNQQEPMDDEVSNELDISDRIISNIFRDLC